MDHITFKKKCLSALKKLGISNVQVGISTFSNYEEITVGKEEITYSILFTLASNQNLLKISDNALGYFYKNNGFNLKIWINNDINKVQSDKDITDTIHHETRHCYQFLNSHHFSNSSTPYLQRPEEKDAYLYEFLIKLTVKDLKKYCKRKKIPLKGKNKLELINALIPVW